MEGKVLHTMMIGLRFSRRHLGVPIVSVRKRQVFRFKFYVNTVGKRYRNVGWIKIPARLCLLPTRKPVIILRPVIDYIGYNGPANGYFEPSCTAQIFLVMHV